MALHTIPVRSFASEHDPPLKIFGIPARYANATYVAASKQSKLDVVEKDLLAFAEVRMACHLSPPFPRTPCS